jgi:L-asparaginase
MMPKPHSTKPCLIIHGGAGNISRTNLSPEAYTRYATELIVVNGETSHMLENGATALDAATHAVRLLEDCPLFNCGKGAVFTRDGTIELEASVSEISAAWYWNFQISLCFVPICLFPF